MADPVNGLAGDGDGVAGGERLVDGPGDRRSRQLSPMQRVRCRFARTDPLPVIAKAV